MAKEMAVGVTKGSKVPGENVHLGVCTFGSLGWVLGGEGGVCLAAGMLGAQGFSSAPVQMGSHLQ